MPTSDYDNNDHGFDDDGLGGEHPDVGTDFDDPGVFEFASPLIEATLEMLPISTRARDSATTLLHELTDTMKKQRLEGQAIAKVRAQEKLEQEKEDREVAARMGRLTVEREANERLREMEDRQREEEVQEALRRGALAEATLEGLANAHWVEKTLVGAAREQARSLKTAIETAERLGVSPEVIEASLRVLLAEQAFGTSKLVTDILHKALEIGATSRLVKPAKGKSYGPVA